MKTKKQLIMVLLISALGIASCKKESISPNGNAVTETRSPGAFNAIKTSETSPIIIRYGATPGIELKGSQNLIEKYKTTVANGVLTVGFDRVNPKENDIKVYITLPVLSQISSFGTASIEVLGNFPNQERLSVKIGGTGNLAVSGSMTTNVLAVDVSGSGNADLVNLTTKDADLSISGTGFIKTDVTEKLKVKITGSGNVHYKGSPVVQADITGTGKLLRL